MAAYVITDSQETPLAVFYGEMAQVRAMQAFNLLAPSEAKTIVEVKENPTYQSRQTYRVTIRDGKEPVVTTADRTISDETPLEATRIDARGDYIEVTTHSIRSEEAAVKEALKIYALVAKAVAGNRTP